MANKKHKIKVALSSAPTRTAVMIDPKEGTIIAEGSNSAQLTKRLYGRR